jgi:DNA-binding response OmpR family regulator
MTILQLGFYRNLFYYVPMTKIAIIEDDPVISQMYRMKFEADGFDVQLASNGIHGVALVEEYSPDIILMDLQMPEMTGEEALHIIRKNIWGKDIPVIVLTNLGEEEAPKSIRGLGIDSYLVKAELTPRQVVQRVKDALERSSH